MEGELRNFLLVLTRLVVLEIKGLVGGVEPGRIFLSLNSRRLLRFIDLFCRLLGLPKVLQTESCQGKKVRTSLRKVVSLT